VNLANRILIKAGLKAPLPPPPEHFPYGYGDEEIATRGLLASGRDCLGKPFTPAQLRARVHALLMQTP
jgi:hypothetical protein